MPDDNNLRRALPFHTSIVGSRPNHKRHFSPITTVLAPCAATGTSHLRLPITLAVAAKMELDTLPTEILTHIFLSLPDIASVLALSATCQRFSSIFSSSKKLVILNQAADAEYGPIEDIIQLLTQNDSQSAHVQRNVPLSEALLHQIIKTGRIAQRFEDIYPLRKWKSDYANRRLLTSAERYRLRRAIYRLWLYDKAFHNSLHVRTGRGIPAVVRERAALLQNFSTSELAEMHDFHMILRDVVANNVCPSNGKIRRKFQKRYPENHHQLLCNIHLNYPVNPTSYPFDRYYYQSTIGSTKYGSHLMPSRWHEPGAEGWGDDITHYYVVEDMMKLNPEQVLFLQDHCPVRADVEMHVRGLGEWFVNNGETFSETLAVVVRQRGGDSEDLKAAIEDGEYGVAVVDD